MPVVLSFDVTGTEANETTRVRSFFERLGWEDLGGNTFRYPRLGTEGPGSSPEDWFNHVVPALMLFRAFALAAPHRVNSVTLDVHSSTGYRRASSYGTPPLGADEISLFEPRRLASAGHDFADDGSWSDLEEWLDDIKFPQTTS
jgi:hypothetical protein